MRFLRSCVSKKKARSMSDKCCVPDCVSHSIHLSGLCRSCYIYAATLVFHHMTTWEQLEASGWVKPATGQIQSPKRPVRSEWFSRATTWTPDGMMDELRRRLARYQKERKQ